MRLAKTPIAVLATILVACAPVFAQSGGNEGRVFRTIGMIGGAVGGAFVGWFLVDDDAINAEQKLAVSMTLCAVGGGVGGYFLGRAADKAMAYSDRVPQNPLESRRSLARLVQSEAEKFRAAHRDALGASRSRRPDPSSRPSSTIWPVGGDDGRPRSHLRRPRIRTATLTPE
jgi:hypothetical protein